MQGQAKQSTRECLTYIKDILEIEEHITIGRNVPMIYACYAWPYQILSSVGECNILWERRWWKEASNQGQWLINYIFRCVSNQGSIESMGGESLYGFNFNKDLWVKDKGLICQICRCLICATLALCSLWDLSMLWEHQCKINQSILILVASHTCNTGIHLVL